MIRGSLTSTGYIIITSMIVFIFLYADEGIFKMITVTDKTVFVYYYKAGKACLLINTNFLKEHLEL